MNINLIDLKGGKSKRLRVFLALIATFAGAASPGFAQTPQLTSLFPSGIRRGMTATLTLQGDHLTKDCRLIVSGSRVTGSIEEATEDGKSMNVRLAAAPDADFGRRELRLLGPKGASNARHFLVGFLPEATEKDPNGKMDLTNHLETPVVASGRMDPVANVDRYQFRGKPGEAWTFTLESAALDSPLDAFMTLLDGRGREIESVAQSGDSPLRLLHSFEKDEEITLVIRDLRYRGGSDYIYRLTAGRLPVSTQYFPLGLTRGKTTLVQLEGVGLGKAVRELSVPEDYPDSVFHAWFALSDSGKDGEIPPFQPMTWIASSIPEKINSKPIPSQATAMKLDALPVAVSSSLRKPGGKEFYRFSLPKDGKATFEIFARRLGSRLDSMLQILDASGKERGRNDDAAGKDSRLALDLPKGDYYAVLSDLPGGGGDGYFYRLAITLDNAASSHPDFALRASPDTLNFGKGASEVVTVSADRSGGFDGEIDVRLEGLPAGVVASPAVIPSGAQTVALTLTATADAPLGGFQYRVIGASRSPVALERTARPMPSPDPPPLSFLIEPLQFQVAGVRDPPPYTLDVDPKSVSLAPGGTVKVNVSVIRKLEDEAAKGEIALEVENVPQGVTVEAPPVPADQMNGTITLKASEEIGPGIVNLIVRGRLKESLITAPAVTLTLSGKKG